MSVIQNLKRSLKTLRVLLCNRHKLKAPCSVTFLGECSFEGANVINKNSIFSGDIGYGSYLGKDSVFYGSIGRFTSIGPDLHVNLGKHPLNTEFATLSPMFYSLLDQSGSHFCDTQRFDEISKGVKIGNDCWIGERVFIAGGIVIGDGAVVLSCAAVVKDVPDYAIVGGVPAKIIGYRYSQEICEKIKKTKWWAHDEIWYRRNWKLLTDINLILRYYETVNSISDNI